MDGGQKKANVERSTLNGGKGPAFTEDSAWQGQSSVRDGELQLFRLLDYAGSIEHFKADDPVNVTEICDHPGAILQPSA